MMQTRWPGLILLLCVALGLLYGRSVWAAPLSADHPPRGAALHVQVSPLALVHQGQVTVRVDGEPCLMVTGAEAGGVCPDLPPGDYAVSATAPGYSVVPAAHTLHVAADEQGALQVEFNFYRADHRVFMPLIQP
jgi:hypothetical protein